jgi:hypothetical protein
LYIVLLRTFQDAAVNGYFQNRLQFTVYGLPFVAFNNCRL